MIWVNILTWTFSILGGIAVLSIGFFVGVLWMKFIVIKILDNKIKLEREISLPDDIDPEKKITRMRISILQAVRAIVYKKFWIEVE
jgi:hypothetical protein